MVPVVAGQPPETNPSRPGVTFQDRPRVEDCDPAIPNSAHPGVAHLAFADGSVRSVSAGVSPQAFWSAVTPAGGESIGID